MFALTNKACNPTKQNMVTWCFFFYFDVIIISLFKLLLFQQSPTYQMVLASLLPLCNPLLQYTHDHISYKLGIPYY